MAQEAHFPSREELEEIPEVDKAMLLVTNPNYISIKRQLFIYALQHSVHQLLDIIRSLNFKRDLYPVQDIPFILSGGTAVTVLAGSQLETPDLDIELSPFDPRAARSNRPVCWSEKGVLMVDDLFHNYVKDLYAQLCERLQDGLSAYEQISLADTKKDVEIVNGVTESQFVGNVYVALLFNPNYFSKIVILAKVGALTERILELKFPSMVFGPVNDITVTTSGLVTQSREKMIQDNIKSMNDKIRKMGNAMREYNYYYTLDDDADGKESGYWMNYEDQKRDAIITYKVRIVSHVRRLQILGGFTIDMIDPANRRVFSMIPGQLGSYVTPMEREEIERAIEAQEIEAKAAAAAAEEKLWKQPKQKKAAKGRVSPELPVLKTTTAFAALAEDEDFTLPAVVPTPVSSIADMSIAAPIAAMPMPTPIATTEPVIEPTPIATTPVSLPRKRPSKMILFIEKPSIDNSSTFNNLDLVLTQKTFILEVNMRHKRSNMVERKPIPEKFTMVIDDSSLNGAEEIIYQIIPSLLKLYTAEQDKLNYKLRYYIDRLEGISWDINNKEIRDGYKRKFDIWRKAAAGQRLMTRALLKSTFRYIFDWSHSLLNDIFLQTNEHTGLMPDPYKTDDLTSPFMEILKEIDSKTICPCELDMENIFTLGLTNNTTFMRMKARNLLFALDQHYPSFTEDSIPILFFSYQHSMTEAVMKGIFSAFNSVGIMIHTEIYDNTVDFLNLTNELSTDEENLMVKLSTSFIENNDERAIHFEIMMAMCRHIWSRFTDKDREVKDTLCRFFIYLLDNEFICLNTVDFWNVLILQDLPEVTDDSDFYELLLPFHKYIKNKEFKRDDMMGDLIRVDLMYKIEEQEKRDKAKAAQERERLNAEAKAAGNALLAEIDAEKKKKKGKKKGGFKTRKNRR